jgi:hypothetical protein
MNDTLIEEEETETRTFSKTKEYQFIDNHFAYKTEGRSQDIYYQSNDEFWVSYSYFHFRTTIREVLFASAVQIIIVHKRFFPW